MFRKLYHRIYNAVAYWRLRRLYYRLFWLYAEKTDCASYAISQADEAFAELTNYRKGDLTHFPGYYPQS